MTTWNRGWVYSRHVATAFPPLSMFLRTLKMKPEVFLLFTGIRWGFPVIYRKTSVSVWVTFLFKHEMIHLNPFPPLMMSGTPPLTLAWPLLFITFFSFFAHRCTHTGRQRKHIHIRLPLSFLNKQGHFNYLSFFGHHWVISLHLCHLVVPPGKSAAPGPHRVQREGQEGPAEGRKGKQHFRSSSLFILSAFELNTLPENHPSDLKKSSGII